MLRPAITQLRDIADELFEENKTLEEKPVKTAVEEFAAGKFKIVEYK